MHFFLKEPLKAPMTLHFCIFLFVLELTHLSWHKMSKFPDFIGFWEFPKDSKVIPIHVQNSQELGKFPGSSHTGHASVNEAPLIWDVRVCRLPPYTTCQSVCLIACPSDCRSSVHKANGERKRPM